MLIKLSVPGIDGPLNLSQFTGNDKGEIDGCLLVANDDNLVEADAWFVIEDLPAGGQTACVPARQTHYLSAETAWRPDRFASDSRTKFLRQFYSVHTFLKNRHPRTSFAPPFLPWMINANHGTVFAPHSRDLRFFENLESLEKKYSLSVFCSNISWRQEHKERIAFVEKAKAYFRDEISWFGNGINPLGEKWEGLASFERTLVLENNRRPGVFSEKIIDPYLALSQPIFYGNPRISEAFPVSDSHQIDISDTRTALQQIGRLISNPLSQQEREELLEGKRRALGEHHFLRRICGIAKKNYRKKLFNSRIEVSLKPMQEI